MWLPDAAGLTQQAPAWWTAGAAPASAELPHSAAECDLLDYSLAEPAVTVCATCLGTLHLLAWINKTPIIIPGCPRCTCLHLCYISYVHMLTYICDHIVCVQHKMDVRCQASQSPGLQELG